MSKHVQDDLCILRIALIPPVVKGFTRSGERDRGNEAQLEAGLEESIAKWLVIFPGSLEAN